MDVKNADHKLKNALFSYGMATTLLKNLTRRDGDAKIQETEKHVRAAWRHLKAVHAEFVAAVMEGLGR